MAVKKTVAKATVKKVAKVAKKVVMKKGSTGGMAAC